MIKPQFIGTVAINRKVAVKAKRRVKRLFGQLSQPKRPGFMSQWQTLLEHQASLMINQLEK